MDKISIIGAKEHNLKNVDLEIPKNKLIVITGVSGSGKSSLAFDTIYAEGQRRYVESLSSYARQFLDKMKKPKVDLIEGLSPAISIEQKNTSKNPRSTVATVTEIYDYMRVLYARAGTPYSPFTGKPIKSQSVAEIVDKIKKLPKKNTIYLLAPIVRGRKGEYKKEIASYKRRGFQRIKVDGEYYNIDKFPELNKKVKHDISIVVDRIIVNSDLGNRLAEGVETALNLADGLLFVEYENETLPKKYRKIEKVVFSSKFACPESGFTIEEIEPRLFSFNSPYGACEECEGIGVNLNVDPNLVVPNEKKTIADGAVEPWSKSSTLYYAQTLASLAKHYKFSLNERWSKLSKKIKDKKVNFEFNKEYINVVTSKIANNDALFITNSFKEMHTADAADIIEHLSENDRENLIKLNNFKIDPEVFIELNESIQSEIIKYLSSETIVTILKNLESDDAIKILENIDEKNKNTIY